MKAKEPSLRAYLTIYAVLIALLVATVAAASVDFGQYTGLPWLNTAIALIIALIKALLVVLFFMHVMVSSRTTWVIAAAGFFWLAILLVLTAADYSTRTPNTGGTARPGVVIGFQGP